MLGQSVCHGRTPVEGRGRLWAGNCGSTCVARFGDGTTVTLIAQPLPGSTFSGWSGDCTGTGTGACVVSMTHDHTAGARFDLVTTGGGGGGSGGGGSSSVPDLALSWSLRFAQIDIGGVNELIATITNKGGASSLQTHFRFTLPQSLGLVGPPQYEYGQGCTGTQQVDCFLDVLGDRLTTRVIFDVKAASAGQASITGAVTADRDANALDNTATVTFLVGAAPSPAPPLPPVTANPRPVILAPTLVPSRPTAGRRLTVSFPVRRSDDRKPLTTGRMSCDPSVAGKVIRHAESLRRGVARLDFVVPKAAKGKLLKVKLTIWAPGGLATRVYTARIR